MSLKKKSMNSRSAGGACHGTLSPPRPTLRNAIATVELAICLPLLALIMFGSIQATNLIFLQHATTAAVYEGSLEMAKSNATNASVQSRIQQVLDARQVVDTSIAILPSGTDVSQTPPGTLLTLGSHCRCSLQFESLRIFCHAQPSDRKIGFYAIAGLLI